MLEARETRRPLVMDLEEIRRTGGKVHSQTEQQHFHTWALIFRLRFLPRDLMPTYSS